MNTIRPAALPVARMLAVTLSVVTLSAGGLRLAEPVRAATSTAGAALRAAPHSTVAEPARHRKHKPHQPHHAKRTAGPTRNSPAAPDTPVTPRTGGGTSPGGGTPGTPPPAAAAAT